MKSLFFSRKFLLGMGVIGSAAIISCNNNSESEIKPDTTQVTTATAMPETKDTSAAPILNHLEVKIAGTYADTTVDGTVKLDTDAGGKVIMNLDMTIPAKSGKTVAVHLHEHGNCSDTAKMAHGHWNPTNAQHGKWGSASFHSGDIGNIKLDAKGKGTLSLTTDLWTLGGKPDKNILGKAIIVHGGVDDYKTQPTGNSGTRIGCGVIQ